MASKFPETFKYLVKYGNSVENEIETRLTNNGKIATGKLYDSIGYTLTEDRGGFNLKFKMAEYGKYVDKGVKPHPEYLTGKGTGRKSKFITALKKWCRVKGIPEGAAYGIRRKIWKDGIKPTNFFTIPTTRRQKQFEKGFADAIAKDIEDNIK
jgi:hypothetical protein